MFKYRYVINNLNFNYIYVQSNLTIITKLGSKKNYIIIVNCDYKNVFLIVKIKLVLIKYNYKNLVIIERFFI